MHKRLPMLVAKILATTFGSVPDLIKNQHHHSGLQYIVLTCFPVQSHQPCSKKCFLKIKICVSQKSEWHLCMLWVTMQTCHMLSMQLKSEYFTAIKSFDTLCFTLDEIVFKKCYFNSIIDCGSQLLSLAWADSCVMEALWPCGPLNVRGPSYLVLTRSISWLLMPWLLMSPGHQQPWYWLTCRIGRFLSYLRKDFNYLHRTNVVKWHKM